MLREGTWKGLKEIEEKVRRFESGCLRKIMKVRLYEHISEVEIRSRQRKKRKKVSRWRWYGHVLRMPEDRLPNHTTKWNAEGSRRRGRPKDI